MFIIRYILIIYFSVTFCQESEWEKSSTSIMWKSFSGKMKFRDPIVFTPFEIKLGYLNYGGNNYWSGLPYNSKKIIESDIPILLDSTQYDFNIIDAIKNRKGIFIEVDMFRTNLPHFIFFALAMAKSLYKGLLAFSIDSFSLDLCSSSVIPYQ